MKDSFCLKGRIIGKDNHPFSDCKVFAYDRDPFLNPNDFLGLSIVDKQGFFQIKFDKSKFIDISEFLEGSPDIFLVLKNLNDEEILKTREKKTKKEIKYHIKISKTTPDPDAPDIYSGNAMRMINIISNMRKLIGLEYDINKDILNKNNISKTAKEKSQTFVDNYKQITDNIDNFLVILKGLINSSLEELNLGIIKYDGPQVPRLSHQKKYNQVIIWPREEKFKWE